MSTVLANKICLNQTTLTLNTNTSIIYITNIIIIEVPPFCTLTAEVSKRTALYEVGNLSVKQNKYIYTDVLQLHNIYFPL